MCNPALHSLWKTIGKPAGIRNPLAVWGIVSCLMQDDPILHRLNDKGKVALLADVTGLKPLQVALVLAGLQHYGLMVEGRVELGLFDDENVLKASERLNQTIKTSDTERVRLLRQARNRRYYRKSRGLPVESDRLIGADIKTVERLNQTPPSLEEREQEQLFPSSAREEPIRPAQGWGVQAEADKKARAERWLSNVTEYARERMSQSDWARLLEGAMADPRPRWAQAQLDEWSRLMKADKERPPPNRPDPRQPEMLMPIGGSTSNAALKTGIRADWDERMVRYRRMVGA